MNERNKRENFKGMEGGSAQEAAPEASPESREEQERLELAARNIIECFGWQPEKEGFTFVTDKKVMEENARLVEIIQEELQKRAGEKGHFRTLVIPKPTRSAEDLGPDIGRHLMDTPALIMTAKSRSHSAETGRAIRGENYGSQAVLESILHSLKLRETIKKGWSGLTPDRLEELTDEVPATQQKLIDLAHKRRARIMSITKGHNPGEILTRGAAEEEPTVIKERVEEVDKLMQGVERVHITSPLGTNLWLEIRPDKKELEDGDVSQPGKLSNFPFGEWACSLKWEGSQGTLVVDGAIGGGINKDKITEPVKLTVEQGRVTKIEGGEAAGLLETYLESDKNKKGDPYKLAELGLGVNSKACEGKPDKDWGSTETEKKLGTVHVAVGSNGSFGVKENDPYYNGAKIHCDMVLIEGVDLEATRKDGSTFKMIENGQTIGY